MVIALTQIVDTCVVVSVGTLGTSVSVTLTNIPSIYFNDVYINRIKINGGYTCNSFEGYEGSTCKVDTAWPLDNGSFDPLHADHHI